MKRYGLDYGGINYDGDGEDLFLEDSEGEWVKYEDVQKLVDKLNEFKGKLTAVGDELHGMILDDIHRKDEEELKWRCTECEAKWKAPHCMYCGDSASVVRL